MFNLSRRITEAAWRENKRASLEWIFLVNSSINWVLWKVNVKIKLGVQKIFWKVTFVKGHGRKPNEAGRIFRL